MRSSVESLLPAPVAARAPWLTVFSGWREVLIHVSNARCRRRILRVGMALAIALLYRAVSNVWSFEGTTVAASAREPAKPDPPEPRAFYARRAELENSIVLHGAGKLDETDIAGYHAAFGENPPQLRASSVDFSGDLKGYFAQLRTDLNGAESFGKQWRFIPEIGLSLGVDDWAPQRAGHLQAGKDRHRTAELITGLRSLHRPVFLRIGPGSNAQENGYDPARYVAAYRRIATAIRTAGLNEVAMVWEWSPDAELEAEAEGANPRDAAARWQAFYPGDDYVDWWGLTLYSEPAISSPATTNFLAEADRQGFPVMITEAMPKGHEVGEGKLVLDSWFRPFFGLIARSHGIKAFTYIGRDWRNYPQWTTWGDTRVETNPEVLGYLRAQLRSPMFAGAATPRIP